MPPFHRNHSGCHLFTQTTWDARRYSVPPQITECPSMFYSAQQRLYEGILSDPVFNQLLCSSISRHQQIFFLSQILVAIRCSVPFIRGLSRYVQCSIPCSLVAMLSSPVHILPFITLVAIKCWPPSAVVLTQMSSRRCLGGNSQSSDPISPSLNAIRSNYEGLASSLQQARQSGVGGGVVGGGRQIMEVTELILSYFWR